MAQDRARDGPSAAAPSRGGEARRCRHRCGRGHGADPPRAVRPARAARAGVKAARAAGATGVWAAMLHLKDGTKEHFLEVLARHWPELLPRYEQAYRDRAYLPRSFGEKTMHEVARLRSLHEVSDRRRVILKPPPEPEQLSLLN